MVEVFQSLALTSAVTVAHLGGLLSWLTVQAAYPPAVRHLVVSGVSLHLLPLVCGTVAGLQTGLIFWGFKLRLSFDGLHWFHVLVRLELGPRSKRKADIRV